MPLQRWAARIVATAFGLGYSPIAPGTAGSLLPMAALIVWAPPRSWTFLVATAGVYLIGVTVSDWGERLWRRRDPGYICIDEVVGYLVAVLWVPAASPVKLAVAAFFVFRFFDIVKPPPGRRVESLPGGWGVMTDDVVAGVYSNLVLQIAALAGWI